MAGQLVLNQLNIIVRDMDATLAFYRSLGLEIEAKPGEVHASVTLENGLLVEFDAAAFASKWDTGSSGATGGSTVLGVAVASREDVDRLCDVAATAGGRSRQPPYDAFWGARYAIVEDPDGNPVGLMSPVDKARKFWPPSDPPKAP
jgi:predicted lactoylglutathione lyase